MACNHIPTLFVSRGGSKISQRGCANPKEGAPIYYLPNFPRKLHENEDILPEGARVPVAPLDPTLVSIDFNESCITSSVDADACCKQAIRLEIQLYWSKSENL